MFLKSSTQLQTTRSPRLLNGFWWFFVQNKVESLLVLFLLFPAHFYCVENNKTFDWSLKLCFPPLISVYKSVRSSLPCWKSTMPPMPTWIIYKYRILNFPPPSVFFSYLSSWWSPSLSPNGAVCDGILQIKKILTRNQEWKCLPQGKERGIPVVLKP